MASESTKTKLDKPVLVAKESGLTLSDNELELCADFTESISRIKKGRVESELLVKASRIKNFKENRPMRVLDATAGLGEDSILLAAAGFIVDLYEYDATICALLRDAMTRAVNIPELAPVIERMTLHEGDSIRAMENLDYTPDVILLDPMFPQRQKSAAVKKKFQLLQKLERPCDNEEELLDAALGVHPKRIVIKRPAKGPFLAGRKPDYSIEGKAIRYDVIVPM